MAKKLKTHFAPPERSTPDEIEVGRRIVRNSAFYGSVARVILDSIHDMLLILDKNRQALYANKRLIEFLGLEDEEPIIGRRPGEIFGCMYATEEEAGCGTSKFCKSCGAIKAILDAQHGKRVMQECRLLQKGGNAIDLAVSAAPFEIEEYKFTLFIIADISDHKRREVLERVFFHDILNISNIITILSGVLKAGHVEKVDEYGEKLEKVTKRLAEAITSHREFILAEQGELDVHPSGINSKDVIKETVEIFSELEEARDREIVVECASDDLSFINDPILLRRVFGNMIKNALEATPPGGEVRVGCRPFAGGVSFSVHNDGVIPDEVQLEIFKRSFSTKDKGRGLGTYSMKLLGEHYLGGKVHFISNARDGTTFMIDLPLEGPSKIGS